MARHHRQGYHDAVIFELDGVVAGTASGDVPKR
jgi:hypothetical protein